MHVYLLRVNNRSLASPIYFQVLRSLFGLLTSPFSDAANGYSVNPPRPGNPCLLITRPELVATLIR